MPSHNLSVIVPVYNTAPYIERCIRSLMEQTLDDIEYIIINDASPDNAIEIAQRVIDDYPNRKPFVKIINHTENKGIAFTRQEGHDLATGEYIIHCDSDDWVDANYYETLYKRSTETRSDMTIGFYKVENHKESIDCWVPKIHNWSEFQGYPKWVFIPIWAHMIKRDFLIQHNLNFYPGINYSEDYGLLVRCYYYANLIEFVEEKTYYHYSKTNTNSLTASQYSFPHIEAKERCMTLLSDFLKDNGVNILDNATLFGEMRGVKEGYYLMSPPDFQRWRKAFPEITPKVLRDKKLSMSYRIAWWLGQYLHSLFMKSYIYTRTVFRH